MGCGGSKQEEPSEAVTLCASRCHNLSEAVRFRFALADAHASYLKSLSSLGLSLRSFFDVPPSASPLLTLPAQRKGDPLPPLSPPVAVPARHSHSNSGHIAFNSDDDDGPLHSDVSSPMHYSGGIRSFTTAVNFNFAKKGPVAEAVTFEQSLFGDEIGQVQVGGFGPGDSSMYPNYYSDPYGKQSSNLYGGADAGYGYAYPYPDYGAASTGFFGSVSQPVAPAEMAPAGGSGGSTSTSHAPPDPPSPPKASTWDFLNPFESYDGYFENFTPSRSSRELREEEGIPDLEDDEHEVVKEAYGDEMSKVGPSYSGEDGHLSSKGVHMEGEGSRRIVLGDVEQNAEYNVQVVSKIAVSDDVREGKTIEGSQRKVLPGSRPVHNVVNEVMSHFNRANVAGEEVSKMLEVGKLQYHQKKYQVVSSRIRYITPTLSTASSSTPTSKSSEFSDTVSSSYMENGVEKAMEAGNLSSTLQQLYIWEKKLLEEVKVEEDMRLLHERKSKRLKRLDEQGAEPYKIDSTRHVVKKLATKIRIAIQVVYCISKRINKLRDEELWPQLCELIHGFVKMWQVLSECHRSQYQAILEAKSLDAIGSDIWKVNVTHRETTMQLIMELLNWGETFSSWVNIQKCFVRELNEWLKKCLLDEPEVTDDGVIPFSPGRLGAPPVFVICNYWAQAMHTVSEAEVVETMNIFTTNILMFWQRHYSGGHQAMVPLDKRVLNALDRDNETINKAVAAVNKKRTQADKHGGHSPIRAIIVMNQDAKSSSLHSSLQRFFEAMERFTQSILKIYEGLRLRCEEETAART